MAVDCEDRRYCFQITTPNGKSFGEEMTYMCETAEAGDVSSALHCSSIGCHAIPCWICAINNISRQIYLTDNPEVINSRLHLSPFLNLEGSRDQVESDRSSSSDSHYKFWKKTRKLMPQEKKHCDVKEMR
ncbi:hypothetical protein P7K49_020166 [Saguinus oedipus]|uniref:Uncharacterized protein n=1 Tax=Saguinus oedipus TaxID=9490 RepID=A0ABQ9UZG4_SAGOE|nr:hypothetical protein P7K49_020166 [Saguinus oedipus]